MQSNHFYAPVYVPTHFRMDGFVDFAELPSSSLSQSRTCLRAWTTGRSVRCLKARRRSTWRSSSCTGSSPWSWTSSGATWPSSRRRSPRRARRSSRDRWETAAGGRMQDPGRGFSQSHLRLLPSFLPSFSSWTQPVSSSWAQSCRPSRKSSKAWTSWGERQRSSCCWLSVGFPGKTCFCFDFFFFCHKR